MNKTAKITALGGILLALSMVCLYGASFVPGFEITLYTISSVFVPIMIIESKTKGGWILYLACSVMSLLLLPNKMAAIPYILFFGIYGIVKYYVEKIENQALQTGIKLGFYAAIMAVIYKFFYSLLFGSVELIGIGKISPLVLLIGGGVFFIVYDKILTYIISYYYRRFFGKIFR